VRRVFGQKEYANDYPVMLPVIIQETDTQNVPQKKKVKIDTRVGNNGVELSGRKELA
jgi:hypothetical protein